MIDNDEDMNRRVRIIARTLRANDINSVAAQMRWQHGNESQWDIIPSDIARIPLLGNEHINLQGAMLSLIKDETDDCTYAGGESATSGLYIRITRAGNWEVNEEYTYEEQGDDAYNDEGRVDLDQFD